MIKISYIFPLVLTGLLCSNLLFHSCSNTEDNMVENAALSKVEITGQVNFVGQWMGEGQREFIVRDFVREFEFLNQDIAVNLKFPEEIGFNRYNTNETHEFIKSVLTQPTPEWDVILINDDMEGVANYMDDPEWAKKYLVDFSQYPELINNTISEIDLDNIKERWNGIIPGPFLEGQYWALWTNKNVTDKLGIEVKQFGMTFNDFLGYVKAAYNYNENNDSKIKIFQEASDWTTLFSIVVNLYFSEVGDINEIYNGQITDRKLDAWHKTLKACEQLASYGFLAEDSKTLVWNDIKNSLVEEECLFFSNGSWMYNIWSEKDPEAVMNCVPNEYPAFNKLVTYPSAYPIMWAVHKNSPNKEEAVKFLLKMSQPAMAEKWVRGTKSPTGIKGNLASISFGTDQFEDFSFHIQKTYGANAFKMQENASLVLNKERMYDPIYFLEVVSGTLTADEAMQRIRNNISESIE